MHESFSSSSSEGMPVFLNTNNKYIIHRIKLGLNIIKF